MNFESNFRGRPWRPISSHAATRSLKEAQIQTRARSASLAFGGTPPIESSFHATVLIVVHLMIVVVVVLVVVVLLQRSEGGALGVGGGFMTRRGQASALTGATAILEKQAR